MEDRTPRSKRPTWLRILGALWVTITSAFFLYAVFQFVVLGNTSFYPQNGGNQITFGPDSSSKEAEIFKQGIRQTLVELRQGLETQFAEGCKYMISFPIDSGRTIGIINAACLTSPLQGGGVTLTGMNLSGVVIPTDDQVMIPADSTDTSTGTLTASGQ